MSDLFFDPWVCKVYPSLVFSYFVILQYFHLRLKIQLVSLRFSVTFSFSNVFTAMKNEQDYEGRHVRPEGVLAGQGATFNAYDAK